MHILAMLIIGLIVGALAKLFMPGKDPGGIIVTMLLGIAGSFVAGFIGRTLGWYRASDTGPGMTAGSFPTRDGRPSCVRSGNRDRHSGGISSAHPPLSARKRMSVSRSRPSARSWSTIRPMPRSIRSTIAA